MKEFTFNYTSLIILQVHSVIDKYVLKKNTLFRLEKFAVYEQNIVLNVAWR